MRGVRRVPRENDIAAMPPLVPNGRKAAPERPIGDEGVALELVREQPFAELDRVLFARSLQARRAPGFLSRLDDERGASRLILVRVHAPETVWVALEVERECGEPPRRSEPDELVRPDVHGGPKAIAIALPNRRACPVRGDHQIRAA